jgi:heptosyltransferase-2
MALPAMRATISGMKPERTSLIGQPWLTDLLPFLSLGHVTYSPEIPGDADLGVLFTNSFRSAWHLWRAGVPERIGFRGQWRRPLLTLAPGPEIDMATGHHRAYFLNLVKQIGVDIDPEEAFMRIPPQEREEGVKLIREKGLDERRTVCIAPGAQFGEAKRYPATSYNHVLQSLHQLGWHLLILGTASEHAIGEQCLAGIEGHGWNAAGETSLRQAIQLLCASRMLLCNDSGLMHVAAALGKPTVAIFGATDPKRTSPSGQRVTLLYQPADCSPCLRRKCSVPGQPCMANISAQSVLKACQKWLS